jgi:hypothetical protein
MLMYAVNSWNNCRLDYYDHQITSRFYIDV